MVRLPERLENLIELFSLVADRQERINLLIELADRFAIPPARIARPPYPEERKVPACESEAYAFSEALPDQTLKYYFAVENPQGISAMATAVILDETLSGAPLEEVLRVPEDFVLGIFGNELSMGKSAGLMGMVAMVKADARRHLAGLATSRR